MAILWVSQIFLIVSSTITVNGKKEQKTCSKFVAEFPIWTAVFRSDNAKVHMVMKFGAVRQHLQWAIRRVLLLGC